DEGDPLDGSRDAGRPGHQLGGPGLERAGADTHQPTRRAPGDVLMPRADEHPAIQGRRTMTNGSSGGRPARAPGRGHGATGRIGAPGRPGALACALGLVAAVGCEVVNPGPVEDRFLDDETSHEALVNGSGRVLLEATNWIAYTGALVSREIFPGGQTG